ncbi:hypothetical protein FDUTEX481_07133 [Tolypothrix sp. PCC 7601]|nr:hypothetical protein FDUTEX481_07133 [Tolypothrix sp. PCC 7601]
MSKNTLQVKSQITFNYEPPEIRGLFFWSFVICHLSFVICHLSFVICLLSFVFW